MRKNILLTLIICLSFSVNLYASNWGGKPIEGWNVSANITAGSIKLEINDAELGSGSGKCDYKRNFNIKGRYGADNWELGALLGSQKIEDTDNYTLFGISGKYNFPVQSPLDLTAIVFVNKAKDNYTHYGIGAVNTFKEIGMFKPYAGIGLKKIQFDVDWEKITEAFIGGAWVVINTEYYTSKIKNKNMIDLIFGTDVSINSNFSINAEINLIAENTFSIGGAYKF